MTAVRADRDLADRSLADHWKQRGYSTAGLAAMRERIPHSGFSQLALWADTQLPIDVMIEYANYHPTSLQIRIAIWEENGWLGDPKLDEWLAWSISYWCTPTMHDPALEVECARDACDWDVEGIWPEEVGPYRIRGFSADQARAFLDAGFDDYTFDRLDWDHDRGLSDTSLDTSVAELCRDWLHLGLTELQLVAAFTLHRLPDEVARMNDSERTCLVAEAAMANPERMVERLFPVRQTLGSSQRRWGESSCDSQRS